MGWTAWCEQLLIQAQGGSALGPWAELNKDFYQAFVQEGRWKMYLEGVGNTLKVAVLALILGVVLGLLVAMVRTFHDQQREERPIPDLLGNSNSHRLQPAGWNSHPRPAE